jgi:hypothetical protein
MIRMYCLNIAFFLIFIQLYLTILFQVYIFDYHIYYDYSNYPLWKEVTFEDGVL